MSTATTTTLCFLHEISKFLFQTTWYGKRKGKNDFNYTKMQCTNLKIPFTHTLSFIYCYINITKKTTTTSNNSKKNTVVSTRFYVSSSSSFRSLCICVYVYNIHDIRDDGWLFTLFTSDIIYFSNIWLNMANQKWERKNTRQLNFFIKKLFKNHIKIELKRPTISKNCIAIDTFNHVLFIRYTTFISSCFVRLSGFVLTLCLSRS